MWGDFSRLVKSVYTLNSTYAHKSASKDKLMYSHVNSLFKLFAVNKHVGWNQPWSGHTRVGWRTEKIIENAVKLYLLCI